MKQSCGHVAIQAVEKKPAWLRGMKDTPVGELGRRQRLLELYRLKDGNTISDGPLPD